MGACGAGVFLAVAVSLVLGGCSPPESGGRASPSAEGETGQGAVLGWTGQLEEAIEGNQDSRDLVANAQSGFFADCMAEQGFEDIQKYFNGSRGEDEDWKALEDARLDWWWGVSLPQYAGEYGYHEVPVEDFVETWTAAEEPPPEYMIAASGKEYYEGLTTTSGGCHGRWEELAYDGVLMTEIEMQQAADELWARVEVDSRLASVVIEASDRWSQCMADDGYSFADPHAALLEFVLTDPQENGSVGLAWKTPSPTQEELQVAVVDAQCKVDVAFWDAVEQARDEAAHQVMTSMRPKIEALSQAHARLAENSAKIAATLKQ